MFLAKLRMIIFDAAGTIVDPYVRAPTKVFSYLFQRHDLNLTSYMIRQSMGKYKREHIQDIFNTNLVQNHWLKKYCRKPNEKDVDSLYKEFKPIQYQTIQKYAFEIPHTTRVLQELKKNYNLSYGLTTGFTRKMLDQVLDKNPKLKQLMSSSVASDEVVYSRPMPDMIYKNMKNIEAKYVMKIDDTNVGILEGHNAKTWTVGIVKYGNEVGKYVESIKEFEKMTFENQKNIMIKGIESFQESKPHFIIDTIEDLPKVVKKINIYLECGFLPENLKKNTMIFSKFM